MRKNKLSIQKDEGAVAIVFALLLTPFMLLTSMVIDLGTPYYVDTRLAYACDAAAIAAARYAVADVQTNGAKFFAANFPQRSDNVSVTPAITLSKDQTTVSVQVSSYVPTYLGAIAGIKKIQVKALSSVQRSYNNVEMAMVLDNTGSMASNGKIQGLQTAATNMINILFQNQDTSPYVVVSIVPYVATVNIGSKNKGWLANLAGLMAFPQNVPWKGCVGTVDNFTTMDTDSPPSATRKWPIYLAASTYGLFGKSLGNNDWTTDGYNVNVINSIGGVAIGPNRSCGLPIQPLTNNRPTLLNIINQMYPVNGGGTFGNLGLVWGWNTISPRWVGQWGGIDPKPYNTHNTVKYIVIVTDGENQWYAQPGYLPNGDPTAYGYSQPVNGNLAQGYLGVTSIANSRSFIDQRLLNLCQQIKSNGINIMTVTFEVSDPLAKQIYQQCASEPAYAFEADNSDQIASIFETIGNIALSIRIVK